MTAHRRRHKSRIKLGTIPDDPRLIHGDVTPEEYAAFWGHDGGGTLHAFEERGDGALFYNVSSGNNAHQPEFLRKFIPAIERLLKYRRSTVAMHPSDPVTESVQRQQLHDVEDLECLLATYQKRLTDLVAVTVKNDPAAIARRSATQEKKAQQLTKAQKALLGWETFEEELQKARAEVAKHGPELNYAGTGRSVLDALPDWIKECPAVHSLPPASLANGNSDRLWIAALKRGYNLKVALQAALDTALLTRKTVPNTKRILARREGKRGSET